MKLTKVFAITAIASMLVSAAPKQPTQAIATCLAGSPQAGQCNLGDVLVQGANYGNIVEIQIDGTSMGTFKVKGGNLNATLDFSDSGSLGDHTITIIDAGGKGAGSVLSSVPVTIVAGS